MNRLDHWFEPHGEESLRGPYNTAITDEHVQAAWEAFTAIELAEYVPPKLQRSEANRPVEVALPEPYEPKYAYPLVVWLHGRGGSEREVAEVLPRLSSQNHVGLGIRGNVELDENGFGWQLDNDALAEFEQDLHDTLCLARRTYHVHSERIFVAGFDEGAALALRMLVRHPDWFGGALAFCPRFDERGLPLTRFRELGGQRVLIGSGHRDGIAAAVENAKTARMLEAAGVRVENRVFDAGHEITADMLTEANRWILESMFSAV